MRDEQILAMQGPYIYTASGPKLAIGNKKHQVGDTVCTDGQAVFGAYRQGNTPITTSPPQEEVIMEMRKENDKLYMYYFTLENGHKKQVKKIDIRIDANANKGEYYFLNNKENAAIVIKGIDGYKAYKVDQEGVKTESTVRLKYENSIWMNDGIELVDKDIYIWYVEDTGLNYRREREGTYLDYEWYDGGALLFAETKNGKLIRENDLTDEIKKSVKLCVNKRVDELMNVNIKELISKFEEEADNAPSKSETQISHKKMILSKIEKWKIGAEIGFNYDCDARSEEVDIGNEKMCLYSKNNFERYLGFTSTSFKFSNLNGATWTGGVTGLGMYFRDKRHYAVDISGVTPHKEHLKQEDKRGPSMALEYVTQKNTVEYRDTKYGTETWLIRPALNPPEKYLYRISNDYDRTIKTGFTNDTTIKYGQNYDLTVNMERNSNKMIFHDKKMNVDYDLSKHKSTIDTASTCRHYYQAIIFYNIDNKYMYLYNKMERKSFIYSIKNDTVKLIGNEKCNNRQFCHVNVKTADKFVDAIRKLKL